MIDQTATELAPLVGAIGACQPWAGPEPPTTGTAGRHLSPRPPVEGAAPPGRWGKTNKLPCWRFCTRSGSWTWRRRRCTPPCWTRAATSPRSQLCTASCGPLMRFTSEGTTRSTPLWSSRSW